MELEEEFLSDYIEYSEEEFEFSEFETTEEEFELEIFFEEEESFIFESEEFEFIELEGEKVRKNIFFVRRRFVVEEVKEVKGRKEELFEELEEES